MASSCPSAGTESARSARDDILPAYAITVGRRRRRSPVGLEGVWLRPSEEGNPREVNAREDALNLIRHWHHEDAELRCTCAGEAGGAASRAGG